VAVDAPEGAVRFTSMTAAFSTSVDGVWALLGIASSSTRLWVTSAAFVPPLDLDAGDELDLDAGDGEPPELEGDVGPAAMASAAFDHADALAEVAAECFIVRTPDLGRIPASVTIGGGPAITTDTLQKISGARAPRPTSDEVFAQVDALIRDYERTPGRKGLPGAVAERLGVTLRTAHRYIAAVKAQRANTLEVRFSKAKLEVKK
jgi:hypothetical protein